MISDNSRIKKFCHNVGQNWYHVVLVPKARYPVFQYEIVRNIAIESLNAICDNHKIDLFSLEVMSDHVHLFISCPPNYSIRKMFRIIKGGSSFLIRKKFPSLRKYKHLWNRGTMYRSVGSVNSETVKRYIENSNHWIDSKQKKLF